MKKVVRILQKGMVWAVTWAVLLVGASSYTLLDAFVLPETYQIMVPSSQTVRTRSSATLGDFFGPTGIPWMPPETASSAWINATSIMGHPGNGDTISTAHNPNYDGGYSTATEFDGGYGETSSFAGWVTGESSEFDEYSSSTAYYGTTNHYDSTSRYHSTSIFSGTTEATTTQKATTTYTTVTTPPTTTRTTQPPLPIITDTYYRDSHMVITIQTVRREQAVCHIAEIWVADVSFLRTAFAKDTFGKNIKEHTSVMAKNNGAIFAISGDYYGFRDTGIIIRNGVLYRDVPRSAPDNKTLTIDSNGNLDIVTDGSIAGADLVKNGVWQSWSFGPPLVENGKATKIETKVSKSVNNPRMAIGQLGPLHYLVIAVDGRTEVSAGMTFPQLQQIFL